MNGNVILVPLDGSAFSESALPYAETLALADHRSIRLLCVVETVLEGLFPEYLELNGALNAERRSIAHKHLAGIASRVREHGLDVETATEVGGSATEILIAGARDDVAVTVMATHGRGGADRWVMGSVADKVMRTSTKPVLLVRPSKIPTNDGAVVLRRLLVPLDGSALAQEALQPASDLALATGARLVLLRVVPHLMTTDDWGTRYRRELLEIEAEMVAGAREALDELRARLRTGLQSEAVVLRGPAAETLEDYIHQHQIDLTVMTTHGRGGFSRLVFGSTAERLVHSGTPVLVLHGAREEAAGTQHSAATSATG